jgi:hypothetical protein
VPPALGVTKGNWPAGENCTIQVVGGQQVARLATFGNPGTGLIKLTAGQMTDGPFCPDNANTNRYDADLLRIRKIRVTLWLQAPTDSLRAPLVSGQTVDPLYAARTGVGPKTVPDQIVRFDITPRNLNLTR